MSLLQTLQLTLMRSSRLFVWSATACGLAMLFLFFAVIDYDFYRRALSMSEQVATNVAALTAQDISRNIELYDLSLQSVVEGVSDPEILNQKPELRQKILFDKSATAPGLGALVALDENGDIFLDSLSASPRSGNFADRDYFAAHRDAASDLGLFISRPYRSRLQGNGEGMMISVSRRISKPDGSFGGLVSGSIKLNYFDSLFDKVSIDRDDSIVLLRDDGVLTARNKAISDEVGADWHSAPVFSRLPKQSRGSFISDRSADRLSRLYAFQRVDSLPLIIVVGMPTARILGPWWIKTLVLTAIFAIMAGSVVLLVWLLDSELRRRASAEIAAEQMARTDGLTKLANRRCFDEELSRSWKRMLREGRPISLLMIDVDHFKSFNDTYGHQEGDRVLASVGLVLRDAVKRPDDMAARYGGEEFAVLLPDTDQAGANRIASLICAQIRRLGIAHTGNEHKTVTVSIGTATILPRPGTAKSSLVRYADLALYCAKDEGRNTVCHHNVVSANFMSRISQAS